jgi:hypothetical protein
MFNVQVVLVFGEVLVAVERKIDEVDRTEYNAYMK